MVNIPAELCRIFEYSSIKPLCTLLSRLVTHDYLKEPSEVEKVKLILNAIYKLRETDRVKTFNDIMNNTLNMMNYLLMSILIEPSADRELLADFIVDLSSYNPRQLEVLRVDHGKIMNRETYIDVDEYTKVLKQNESLRKLLKYE